MFHSKSFEKGPEKCLALVTCMTALAMPWLQKMSGATTGWDFKFVSF